MEKYRYRHWKDTQSQQKVNMLKECEHLLPVTNETFDKDFDLFNTQNGYLNLKLANLKNMTSSNTLPRYLMLNTQTNRIVLSGKNFLMTYSWQSRTY